MNHISEYVASAEGAPSGLTDAERRIVLGLAIAHVAAELGISQPAAALQLDYAADHGQALLAGDDRAVTLSVRGRPVVRVGRDLLRALAR